MARGLLGVGTLQKKQALQGLTQAAGLEAQQDIANQQLIQQQKAAAAQLKGTTTAIGGYAGAKIGAQVGSVGGPMGAAIGAAIGFLAGSLFG